MDIISQKDIEFFDAYKDIFCKVLKYKIFCISIFRIEFLGIK